MVTEDDFQAALNHEPSDWQTRLVFADWLEERGDPRAEGYRALGALKLAPVKYKHYPPWYACENEHAASWLRDPDGPAARHFYPTTNRAAAILPADWFDAVVFRGKDRDVISRLHAYTLAELDSAVALAFLLLPPERRAELLAAG